MKELIEASTDYSFDHKDEVGGRGHVLRKAFKAGAEFAQRWISVDEELPPLGVSVLLFNDSWEDEDYNPDGVRIGFRQDDGFTSAHWWNYQSCYMTISKSECEDNPIYSEVIRNTTEPSHWRPIEIK